jgi:hypothetical protein
MPAFVWRSEVEQRGGNSGLGGTLGGFPRSVCKRGTGLRFRLFVTTHNIVVRSHGFGQIWVFCFKDVMIELISIA